MKRDMRLVLALAGGLAAGAGGIGPDAARARPARGKACLSLVSDAPHAVAGSGKSVQLTIQVQPGKRGDPPRLQVDHGKLSELLAFGPDRFSVSYTPPWKPEPTVAIVTARLPDPSCPPAFLPIVVLADKTIDARVTPNARASLTVAGHRFGPLRADAAGWVEFKARLHPAHPVGLLEVAAPGKRLERKRIPLKVEPRPRLKVLALPRAVRADGQTRSRIYAFACNAAGRPLPQARLRARVAVGKAGRMVPLGRGVYRGLYTPPQRITPKRVKLQVQMSRPRRLSRKIELRLLPGIELNIAVAAEPGRLVSDGRSRALVTATVTDEQGRGVEKLPLRIASAQGRMGPVAEQGKGRYQAELVAPVGASGRVQVTAALGRQTGRTSVALAAPPPLRVSAERKTLVADGRSTSPVLVELFLPPDAAEPAKLEARAEGGELALEHGFEKGRAELRFTAGAEAGPARVFIRAGEHSRTLELELVAGKPERLDLRAGAKRVLTDSGAQVGIEARVADAQGNPIPQPNLAFTASRGDLSPAVAAGAGILTATYRPPPGAEGPAVIRAAGYENLAAEIRLELQPPPPRFGLAVSTGLEHNLQRIGAPLVAVEGSVRLTAGLFAAAGLGWFGQLIDAACPAGALDCSSDLRLDALPFWLGLSYRFENATRFTPALGLGAAGVWSRVEVSNDFQPTQQHTAVSPGGYARAGLDVTVGPGGILLELGYLYAEWLGNDAVAGRLGGLSARLGYRFAF